MPTGEAPRPPSEPDLRHQEFFSGARKLAGALALIGAVLIHNEAAEIALGVGGGGIILKSLRDDLRIYPQLRALRKKDE